MKLASVILARAVAYFEIFDLSPHGKVFFPDVVQEIATYYRFQDFPRTVEQHNIRGEDGVVFKEGVAVDTAIRRLTIGVQHVLVETSSNTDDSKRIIGEILTHCAEKFGLNYSPSLIRRFAYVSNIAFYSDVPILKSFSPLEKMAQKSSEALSKIWDERLLYEPTNIAIGHDPTTRRFNIAPFSIARRANTPFSENKYFSESPLPTDLHLKIVEEYEQDIILYGKAGTV